MEYINIKLVKQLKDCTINVSQRNYKNAVAQMFCVKSKFVADCLLSWFNKKFKSQNLELSLHKKIAFEAKNYINWGSDECYICNFPIKVNTKGPNVLNPEMSYLIGRKKVAIKFCL